MSCAGPGYVCAAAHPASAPARASHVAGSRFAFRRSWVHLTNSDTSPAAAPSPARLLRACSLWNIPPGGCLSRALMPTALKPARLDGLCLARAGSPLRCPGWRGLVQCDGGCLRLWPVTCRCAAPWCLLCSAASGAAPRPSMATWGSEPELFPSGRPPSRGPVSAVCSARSCPCLPCRCLPCPHPSLLTAAAPGPHVCPRHTGGTVPCSLQPAGVSLRP